MTVVEDTNEKSKEGSTKSPAKQKLRSIMEAASALTALGDEESDEGGSQAGGQKPRKTATDGTKAAAETEEIEQNDEDEDQLTPTRYLPEHKKPDAAPTFPEKVRDPSVLAFPSSGTPKRRAIKLSSRGIPTGFHVRRF
jgi:hypothetical protein